MQSMSSFSLCVQRRKLLQDSEESYSSAPMTEVSPDFANLGFGPSFVVVIAALFLSILCFWLFNGLLRCRRLNRRWRVVSQPSLNMDVGRAQTCMEKRDLEALPVTVYRTGYPLRAVDCPICLAEFMEGEKVRVLPDYCHSFHAHCIDAWLLSNASCPSCRHSLLCALSKKPSAVSQRTVPEWMLPKETRVLQQMMFSLSKLLWTTQQWQLLHLWVPSNLQVTWNLVTQLRLGKNDWQNWLVLEGHNVRIDVGIYESVQCGSYRVGSTVAVC